jgi:hypothetical protein
MVTKYPSIKLDSKARFGLLYNGREKRAYQRIGNSLVQIKDIPKEKFFGMKSTTDKAIEKVEPFPLPEGCLQTMEYPPLYHFQERID